MWSPSIEITNFEEKLDKVLEETAKQEEDGDKGWISVYRLKLVAGEVGLGAWFWSGVVHVVAECTC